MPSKSVHVAYDHQIFSAQIYGGISRYYCEIISEYENEEHGIKTHLPFAFSNNTYLHDLYPGKFWSVPETPFQGRRRISEFLNKIGYFSKELRRCDVLHATVYDKFLLNLGLDIPLVSTVHDMIPELFPHYFPGRNQHREKERYARASDALICVSENTKKDVVEIYGLDADKVFVIPHGTNLTELPTASARRIDLPDSYVLYIGGRFGYKNFPKFVQAAALVMLKDKNLNLCCIGGGKFNDQETGLLRELGIAERCIQMAVDDFQLIHTYRNAKLLAFPSLYEGFGLPILEAFANDCPVILSDIAVFHETAKDAAVYFDPHDAHSIAEALNAVIKDKAGNAKRIARGNLISREFTWEKSARHLAQIYADISD